MSHQILPECYADTLLVEMLGFERPNHQLSIGSALNALEKKFKNRPAVAVIDNDKVKPKSFDQFQLADEQHGIQVWTKPETRHAVLVVCPAFEDWVFENAAQVEVSPEKYGFRSRKYFRETCKRQNVADNQQVKQFLNTLKQKNAPGLGWLRDLIQAFLHPKS